MPRIALALVSCLGLGACGDAILKPIEDGPSSTGTDCGGPTIERQVKVDYLFVIDNSSSMTREQGVLAESISTLAEVLEDPSVHADYRIAFTTTDNGNPWCSRRTDAAGGDLVLESCVDRLDDFLTPGLTEDVRASACSDHCDLDTASLGLLDAEHPWIEGSGGESNLAPGVDVGVALRCLAPQGVHGCDFVSPLESAYKAILRAGTETEDAYQFLRPDAMLVIVLVTDGIDCSYDHDWESIFDAEGERVFWGDEDEGVPSEALCWRAGTHCIEGEGGQLDCVGVDKDENGQILGPVSQPKDDAVLHPLSRYVDGFRARTLDGWASGYSKEIVVTVIGGVGSEGELSFSSADSEFMQAHGIGPGCTSLDGDPALPPVRSVDLASQFGELRNFSICEDSYDEALRELAKLPREAHRPACYSECVQDRDPDTPLVQPECIVTQSVGAEQFEVPECSRVDGEYQLDPVTHEPVLPEGAALCFAYRVDADQSSSSPLDDLSPECTEEGYNLEFALIRNYDLPRPPNEVISASCILSELPQEDCPDL